MKFLIVLSCWVLSAATYPTYEVYGGGYHGPTAPLAHDGRVIDTPEVAHAKAAHLAAHAAEAAKTAHHGYADFFSDGRYAEDYHGASYEKLVAPVYNTYHGPPAPLAHDGRVIDTPEVAHAKAAHLAAHAEEISKISHYSYPDHYSHSHW